MLERLDVITADITTLKLDAIVNAANASLAPGGGVDGAIRRAGGPDLNKRLAKIGHCDPGSAVLTDGFNLPARYVIHTVGPVWRGGGNEAELDETLARCYRSCLAIAEEKSIRTIAFPSISTGIYGFPIARAAGIAIRECLTHLRAGSRISKIIFCCFSNADRDVYRTELAKISD